MELGRQFNPQKFWGFFKKLKSSLLNQPYNTQSAPSKKSQSLHQCPHCQCLGRQETQFPSSSWLQQLTKPTPPLEATCRDFSCKFSYKLTKNTCKNFFNTYSASLPELSIFTQQDNRVPSLVQQLFFETFSVSQCWNIKHMLERNHLRCYKLNDILLE